VTIFDDKLTPVLEAYGKTVTWHFEASKYYDATDGSVLTIGADTEDVKVSPPQPLSLAQTDGVVFKVGDVEFYMLAPALTFTPKLAQQVEIESVLWNVVQLEELWNGDLLQAYRVVARR